MDEITLLFRGGPGQDRPGEIGAPIRREQRGPADMRHPLGNAPHVGSGQAGHPAMDQAQALVLAKFFGGVEQHLHAQADAQQRRACGSLAADGFHQPQPPQPRHAVPESPHPRQHQGVGGLHRRGVAGEQRFGPAMGKCILNAAQVGKTIINDRYSHTLRTSTPPARISSFSSGTVSLP